MALLEDPDLCWGPSAAAPAAAPHSSVGWPPASLSICLSIHSSPRPGPASHFCSCIWGGEIHLDCTQGPVILEGWNRIRLCKGTYHTVKLSHAEIIMHWTASPNEDVTNNHALMSFESHKLNLLGMPYSGFCGAVWHKEPVVFGEAVTSIYLGDRKHDKMLIAGVEVHEKIYGYYPAASFSI